MVKQENKYTLVLAIRGIKQSVVIYDHTEPLDPITPTRGAQS